MFAPLRGPGPPVGPSGRSFSRLTRRLRQLQLHAAKALVTNRTRLGLLGGGAGTVAVLAAAIPPAPQEDPTSGIPRTRSRSFQDFGHPKRRVTDVLLITNCICFMLQWLSKDLLTFWGAKVNTYIWAGQWWRLLTPTFLHSGLLHLAINCHALNSIGPQVELVGGGARFLTVYMAAAVTGTAASVLCTPAPSLGSSGAIFGLGAALGLFYWRHRDTLGATSDNMLKSLGFTLVINAVYSVAARNIDNWGHLGGMVGGGIVAALLGPHLVRTEGGRFVDRPPLPWLAYKDGSSYSSSRSSDSSSSSSSGSSSSSASRAQSGQGSGGKERERRRRRSGPGQAEPQQQQGLEGGPPAS